MHDFWKRVRIQRMQKRAYYSQIRYIFTLMEEQEA